MGKIKSIAAGLCLGIAATGISFSPAHAGTILTDISTGTLDPFYNNFRPPNTAFLSVINADHTVVQVPGFDNAASFTGADTVWVNAQHNGDSGGGALGAAEIANITSFISAGRRGVIITDNVNWSDFNNSIEQILGATITDFCGASTGFATGTNPLGAGVGGVIHNCGSILDPAANAEVIVSGGIASLYTVGLGEILVITSVDQFAGSSPAEPEFIQNISTFLNTPLNPPVAMSEPGILVIFGLGLAGLGFVRRKRAV